MPLTPVIKTLPGKSKDSLHSNVDNGHGSFPAATSTATKNEAFGSESSIVKRILKLATRHNKPVIMVIDSGELYDPMAKAFQSEGLPVFRSADQAVYVLGKYIKGRLRAQAQRL